MLKMYRTNLSYPVKYLWIVCLHFVGVVSISRFGGVVTIRLMHSAVKLLTVLLFTGLGSVKLSML